MRFPAIATIVLICSATVSCSLYDYYHRPAALQETEAMLSDAGFDQVSVDTPEQKEIAANLPAHELRSYMGESGQVFWYYDPQLCLCVFVGDEKAYQRYGVARAHENDVANYVAQSEDTEAASLYALNGAAFPPPWFLMVGLGGLGPVYGFPGPIVGGGHPGGGGHHGGGGGGGHGGHGGGDGGGHGGGHSGHGH